MRASRLASVGRLRPLILALTMACSDGERVAGPSTGTISVVVRTSGLAVNPINYGVRVDGGPPRAAGAAGNVTFSDVQPGVHTVMLEGVPAGCFVEDGAEQTLTVTAGRNVAVGFVVSCVGSVTVTTTTTTDGGDVDPAGYTAELWTRDDDCGYYDYYCSALVQIATLGIGANGSVTFANVLAHPFDDTQIRYEVRLTGVGSPCSITPPAAQPVALTAGASATVSFAVHCQTTGTRR